MRNGLTVQAEGSYAAGLWSCYRSSICGIPSKQTPVTSVQIAPAHTHQRDAMCGLSETYLPPLVLLLPES